MRGNIRVEFRLSDWGIGCAVQAKRSAWLALSVGLLATGLVASPKVWQGDAGNWHDAENWLGGLPEAGDEAWITNSTANVLLTNATPVLSAFKLERGILIFTNWNTALRAHQVDIGDGSSMTLPPAFMESQMSNRVWIVCSNLTLSSSAVIDVSGKGFAGGTGFSSGHGPGKGGGLTKQTRGGGAGYGGCGGWGRRTGYGKYESGGTPYGLPMPANAPGSGGGGGGGSALQVGGNGGGQVSIEAEGDVLINGSITANGTKGGSYSGGGSGGGVHIACQFFGGSGAISANGGSYGSGSDGGSGGGGRVSIEYEQLTDPPAICVEVREAFDNFDFLDPSTRHTNRWPSAYGTVSFSDIDLLDNALTNFYGRLMVPGLTHLQRPSLTIGDQKTIGFAPEVALQVSGDLVVGTGGRLVLERPASLVVGGSVRLINGRLDVIACDHIQCNADLVLTDGGRFDVYSAAPEESGLGSLVEVAGEIFIGTHSWIVPTTHLELGTEVRFRCNRLRVEADGGIDADGRGLSGGMFEVYGHYKGLGLGHGNGSKGSFYATGAGYGGRGGWSRHTNGRWYDADGGEVYGSSNGIPVSGSGGGSFADTGYGGHGGGVIWVEAKEKVQLDGVLKANGGIPDSCCGGGSGGGIFVSTPRLSGGETALLSANGGRAGNGQGGPGGGGRILVAVGLTSLEIEKLMMGLPAKNISLTHPAYHGSLTVDPSPIGPDYTDFEERSPQPGSALFCTGDAGTVMMVR